NEEKVHRNEVVQTGIADVHISHLLARAHPRLERSNAPREKIRGEKYDEKADDLFRGAGLVQGIEQNRNENSPKDAPPDCHFPAARPQREPMVEQYEHEAEDETAQHVGRKMQTEVEAGYAHEDDERCSEPRQPAAGKGER